MRRTTCTLRPIRIDRHNLRIVLLPLFLPVVTYRHLNVVVVDPLAQGKGVGRALIDYGMQKADASDPSLPCWLEASAAGVPIYKRLGFRQVEWVEIDVDGPQGPQKAGMPAMVRPARLSGPDSIAI